MEKHTHTHTYTHPNMYRLELKVCFHMKRDSAQIPKKHIKRWIFTIKDTFGAIKRLSSLISCVTMKLCINGTLLNPVWLHFESSETLRCCDAWLRFILLVPRKHWRRTVLPSCFNIWFQLKESWMILQRGWNYFAVFWCKWSSIEDLAHTRSLLWLAARKERSIASTNLQFLHGKLWNIFGMSAQGSGLSLNHHRWAGRKHRDTTQRKCTCKASAGVLSNYFYLREWDKYVILQLPWLTTRWHNPTQREAWRLQAPSTSCGEHISWRRGTERLRSLNQLLSHHWRGGEKGGVSVWKKCLHFILDGDNRHFQEVMMSIWGFLFFFSATLIVGEMRWRSGLSPEWSLWNGVYYLRCVTCSPWTV